MQIVIEIPDDFYERVNKDGCMSYTDAEVVVNAFYRGAVLPKGHGRLIDADAIAARFKEHKKFYVDSYGGFFQFMPITDKARCDEIDSCWADVVNEPTIIEADKEEQK